MLPGAVLPAGQVDQVQFGGDPAGGVPSPQVDCDQRVAPTARMVHLRGAALPPGHTATQQVTQYRHTGHPV